MRVWSRGQLLCGKYRNYFHLKAIGMFLLPMDDENVNKDLKVRHLIIRRSSFHTLRIITERLDSTWLLGIMFAFCHSLLITWLLIGISAVWCPVMMPRSPGPVLSLCHQIQAGATISLAASCRHPNDSESSPPSLEPRQVNTHSQQVRTSHSRSNCIRGILQNSGRH